MQSIRTGLAGAIRNDLAQMRRGMTVWLLADATLTHFRALGAERMRHVCEAVLEELQAWLLDGNPERIDRARAALGGLRACLLARSYLLESLKQESYPGTGSRADERTVVGLVDAFFADSNTFPRDLAPTLPPAGHADRAKADAKPHEP